MTRKRDELEKLRPFEANGFMKRGTTDTQVFGDCPFCEREGKFYVNKSNGLWDCKVCGLGGNLSQFLEEASATYVEAMTSALIRKLASRRQLPEEAFAGMSIGWDVDRYVLPVRNAEGSLVDLRSWKPDAKKKQRVMSTPGCHTGLFGAELLNVRKFMDDPIYLCEGEWDRIALRWLLRLLGEPGVVIGVPGSETFKREWAEWFDGRDVYLVYDNDSAGERGELVVRERLAGRVRSMRFVQWPAEVPSKFDVNDWVTYGAVVKRTPRKCWEAMQELWNDWPRQSTPEERTEQKPRRMLKSITSEELYDIFGQHLKMETDEPIVVVFATLLANMLKSDPLWMFLIAPPGGMKSELLMTLNDVPSCHCTSSLTAHTLVSGAQWAGGQDPSLLPKLDGKVLVIKDFTTILEMNSSARDDIFGQLRDAYDGRFAREFGTGVVRRYESRFGCIAGCTPSIDAYASLHAGLGERFLKYRFEKHLPRLSARERIRKAMSNIHKEMEMRTAMCVAAEQFMVAKRKQLQNLPEEDLPKFTPEAVERMIDLSELTAKLRGTVYRDMYNQEFLHAKPSHEIGTRLGKQLSSFAMGVALFRDRGRLEVDDECIDLAAKVAMGSVPDKVEDVVRVLFDWQAEDAAYTSEVVEACDLLTRSTVVRTLEDLRMLGVVKQTGASNKKQWCLHSHVRELVEGGAVWQTK